jgi:hypothetical protein
MQNVVHSLLCLRILGRSPLVWRWESCIVDRRAKRAVSCRRRYVIEVRIEAVAAFHGWNGGWSGHYGESECLRTSLVWGSGTRNDGAPLPARTASTSYHAPLTLSPICDTQNHRINQLNSWLMITSSSTFTTVIASTLARPAPQWLLRNLTRRPRRQMVCPRK